MRLRYPGPSQQSKAINARFRRSISVWFGIELMTCLICSNVGAFCSRCVVAMRVSLSDKLKYSARNTGGAIYTRLPCKPLEESLKLRKCRVQSGLAQLFTGLLRFLFSQVFLNAIACS